MKLVLSGSASCRWRGKRGVLCSRRQCVVLCVATAITQWRVRSYILESRFVGDEVPAMEDGRHVAGATVAVDEWSRFAAETAWTICGGGVYGGVAVTATVDW